MRSEALTKQRPAAADSEPEQPAHVRIGPALVYFPVVSTLLTTAALLTGAAVAVSGVIGFVGLVVPHMIRLLLGPSHRTLLPASVLTGALFLIVCDLLARTVHPPTEIRLGIVTAAFGAPFFLYLLRRRRKEIGYL